MSLFELEPELILAEHLQFLVPWAMKAQGSKSLELLTYKVVEFFTQSCP